MGHIDFLNPEFTTLLGGELTPIHPTAQVKDMLIENSKWFSPNHGANRRVFKRYILKTIKIILMGVNVKHIIVKPILVLIT